MTGETAPEPSTTPPPPASLPSVERWRAKLLDFSGRNRSLFYRPSQSTLNLYIDERELWRLLAVEEATIALDADIVLPPGFRGSTPEDSTVVAAALSNADKRARNLHATMRTFLEEQGVHVLHLPIGWLTWTDETRPPGPNDTKVEIAATGRTARLVRSPLLFVPVALERSARGWRLVRQENEDIEPNLTILSYLKQFHNIDVGIEEDDDIDLDVCFQAYADAVQGREHWQVTLGEDGLLDTFSFKKIALLRELDRSQDLISAQPVLKALSGDSADLQSGTTIKEYGALDSEIQPQDVALAVAADSSQLRAVLAVQDGNSLVIQGPPGTGKSQTITNIISAATAQGRSVLFVAEKKAARDVVVSNLAGAGMSDLVLHITEEVVSGRTARAKQDIADQLRDLLEKGPGQHATDESVPNAVVEVRDRLNAYVTDLHKPLSALSWSSPFKLFEAWSLAKQELAIDATLATPSIREVDDAWLAAIREAASNVDDLGAATVRDSRGPWLHMLPPALELPDTRRVESVLDTLMGLQEALDTSVVRAGLDPGGAWDRTRVVALIDLLSEIGEYQKQKGSILRFVSPSFWRLRSAVSDHLKRGGLEPDNAAMEAELLRHHIDAWQEALDFFASIYPVNFVTVDDIADLAKHLKEALPSFDPAQTVVRTVASQDIDDEDVDLLLGIVEHGAEGASIRDILETVLCKKWAEEALLSSNEFVHTASARERLRRRFADADLALNEYARARALNAFAPNRPGVDTVAPRESELGILRAQVAAKRRKPLRWLFGRAPSAIMRLKPCIVASPLAVAQFLSNRAYDFDLVIFDEASQIPTADAVVAISRARQVVVVGDSQQMPPTAFFDRMLQETNRSDEEFEFESILQECEALLPAKRLLWHYRSQDERLIAFSNQLFYSGSLRTFPASWAEHPDRGVRLEYVEGAVYGRGGSRANPLEAERVVQLLAAELENDPESEVAVTAMSVAQGDEVQAKIEEAASQHELIAAWLDEGNRVKNLETVQGDECDVMLLSFGYGKDEAGNLTLNFGPLSRDDGYRRLNVAVTRARRKTILVASVKASDIPTSLGSGGLLVRRYLDYAERGPIVLTEDAATQSNATKTNDPFEEDVAKRLSELGWQVETRVGVGSYRVDIAVLDSYNPGRYLAGIECDGAMYHSAESARDRDISRQQVLQRLGWNVLRIWSPDWFRDSNEVLIRIDGELRALRDGTPVPAEVIAQAVQEDEVVPPTTPEPRVIKPLIVDLGPPRRPARPAPEPEIIEPEPEPYAPEPAYEPEEEERFDYVAYEAEPEQYQPEPEEPSPSPPSPSQPRLPDASDSGWFAPPSRPAAAQPPAPPRIAPRLPPRREAPSADSLAATVRRELTPPSSRTPETPASRPAEPARNDFTPLSASEPNGTVVYVEHRPQRPDRSLDRWVQALIDAEGPLHDEELTAALRDDLGYQRLTESARSQISHAIDAAVRQGFIVKRGRWLWPPHMRAAAAPVRVLRTDDRRSFKHYSDEEIARAIAIACREAGRLSRDQLAEACARLLGFSLTASVRNRIESLIDPAVEARFLYLEDGMFEASDIA